MTEREANVALIQSYFATIQHGIDPEAIGDFYAPNVHTVERDWPEEASDGLQTGGIQTLYSKSTQERPT